MLKYTQIHLLASASARKVLYPLGDQSSYGNSSSNAQGNPLQASLD